jgi:uncharacterized protein
MYFYCSFMKNKKKIFNDPVYGFVTLPHELIFELIEHPFFQRLRRIKQLGMTDLVYPGALHTRFHHALGAMHLMTEAIETLRNKNIEISDEEALGAYIAILLHDIGHGPFSHALEHTLLDIHHEDISMILMEELDIIFEGKLKIGIAIFCDKYPKPFLHQLVSGQLDMDRMDYLNRDSYFTGVSEGVIGYDRIIKMLNVVDNRLVVEEKGIYSIEKFLIARRLMYWQVYLHKTVVVAEQMLIKILQRAKFLSKNDKKIGINKNLALLLHQNYKKCDFENNRRLITEYFVSLDDYDIVSALKEFSEREDKVISFLSRSLLNRHLFKIETHSEPIQGNRVDAIKLKVKNQFHLTENEVDYLVFTGQESNTAYINTKDEINILCKDGSVKPISQFSDYHISSKNIVKYYCCYPKDLY